MKVNTLGRSNPHTILVKKYPETGCSLWHHRIANSQPVIPDEHTIVIWRVKYFGNAKRHNK